MQGKAGATSSGALDWENGMHLGVLWEGRQIERDKCPAKNRKAGEVGDRQDSPGLGSPVKAKPEPCESGPLAAKGSSGYRTQAPGKRS